MLDVDCIHLWCHTEHVTTHSFYLQEAKHGKSERRQTDSWRLLWSILSQHYIVEATLDMVDLPCGLANRELSAPNGIVPLRERQRGAKEGHCSVFTRSLTACHQGLWLIT